MKKSKIFKRSIRVIIIGIICFNLWVLLSGKSFFYKAVYYNFANIDDYKIFDNRIIKKSESPQPWPLSINYNKAGISQNLQSYLEKNKSIAFLIIKNDSLVHEQYWDGYDATSKSNSFSVAKSFVSSLIGVAIKEGKIKSVDQPVSEFLPEFKEGDKKNITIKHLLMMSSGLNWNESYANPLSVTTEAYYGTDLIKAISGLNAVEEPGKIFSYKSGDTQILGFVIEKATGKSLSDYAHEKLWSPMGAEQDALWSVDKDQGHEKAYCCINSNARDFARFGNLYLHKGNWKGNQIIDTSYVERSITPHGLMYEGKPSDFYGFQWWVVPDYKGKSFFYARGILGQLIVVVPDKNMVVVRLGEKNGEKAGIHFGMIFQIVDELEANY
jgi:CubicO group peptidase (beta-lactamase class C family)